MTLLTRCPSYETPRAKIPEIKTTLSNSMIILFAVTSIESLTITPITDKEYREALQLLDALNSGINSSLACIVMTELHVGARVIMNIDC